MTQSKAKHILEKIDERWSAFERVDNETTGEKVSDFSATPLIQASTRTYGL